MIIPLESLSEEILTNIIKEFVLQEGTDYGQEDLSLADKVIQVKAQLTDGSAVVVYSELHETVNILPAERFTD
jgi:uncharacterized protein YheU (UPF0270 family)